MREQSSLLCMHECLTTEISVVHILIVDFIGLPIIPYHTDGREKSGGKINFLFRWIVLSTFGFDNIGRWQAYCLAIEKVRGCLVVKRLHHHRVDNWQVIKLWWPFLIQSHGKIEIMHLAQHNTTKDKHLLERKRESVKLPTIGQHQTILHVHRFFPSFR